MHRRLVIVLSLAGAACSGAQPAVSSPPPNPSTPMPPSQASRAPAPPKPLLPYPPARRTEQSDVIHGVSVADPYRWLEEAKTEEVAEWASAQNDLARAELAKLPGRDEIAARLKELFYVESTGTPRRAGGRLFYPHREATKEKVAVVWRAGKAGPEKTLLDPNTWSADGSVSLGVWSVSYDGRKVAYTVKSNNSDEATLYVLDVATGAKSPTDVIEGAKYAFPSWTPAGDGFYYTRLPPTAAVAAPDRPGYAEVCFHKLGSDPSRDPIVHEKTGDPKTFISAGVDRSGRWLIATIEHGWTRTDIYVRDLHAAKADWKPLVVGKDARYDVNVDRGLFFVSTNEEAPNYRVFRVDPGHMDRERWVEIVPERSDATLEAVTLVGHHLSLAYLKDVTGRLEVRDTNGKLVREVRLPGLGSVSALSGEVDDDVAYYSFQSFTYPTEIFETSVATGKTSTWYKLKVPVDPSKYVADQFFATSRDGTRVPFFILHAQGAARTGSTPTILYGYGGFQAAQSPVFAASIYPWLEHGGNWVVANLRGGSEYGEAWHRGGMRHEKQHVFDDYFAIAEELVRQGFTRPDKLAALGGSNGGLLVGAAITQRPELFGAALCGVPLLDMVRYQLFGSGKTWAEEYGSVADAEDFAALYAYSPYHHVTQGKKYPATLLLSADSDDRVDPMHARKFAAALQWASTGGPVLLRVEKHSGHGGADLVRASVEKVADEYAFALTMLGAAGATPEAPAHEVRKAPSAP